MIKNTILTGIAAAVMACSSADTNFNIEFDSCKAARKASLKREEKVFEGGVKQCGDNSTCVDLKIIHYVTIRDCIDYDFQRCVRKIKNPGSYDTF